MARRPSLSRPALLPDPGADEALEPDREWLAQLGEQGRRVALGLAAALIAARAYWPAEPNFEEEAGTGLVWALAVLMTVGLAIAASFIGGTFRFRWSWADAAVMALTLLIGLSAARAADRRPAINLAWEWGAVGLAYLLVRNLPRTRDESSAIAAVLLATASAVAVYGIFQVAFELPMLREAYKKNPIAVLQMVGARPGTPAQKLFENRLLHSNEPWSTFALANSLAGFLVGPLVVALAVGWENLLRRDDEKRGLGAIAMAAVPALLMLICLVLTKSRSAYVGLAVALAVLAWRSRRLVRARTIALAALGVLVVVSALVVVGLKTGRLDRQVLTESGKSLRYRREYWVGAWRAIASDRRTFWRGLGPGNFGWAYLRHKLPESSEEIRDPHDMFLEAWATAGLWAAVALGLALGFGLYETLGPASKRLKPESAAARGSSDEAPPARAGWLVGWGGAGLVLVLVVGQFNLFQGDLYLRWLILFGAWVASAMLIGPLWRRRPIPAWALGLGALAVAVNLLAAGGFGISSVALMLWALIALGLNLRDDRPCQRVRAAEDRLPAFGLAAAWAALVGIFIGAIGPFWAMEADLREADDALRARPPRYDRAGLAYDRAYRDDIYSPRPWLGLAYMEARIWEERGAKPGDRRWQQVPILLRKAVDGERNPNAWVYHIARADFLAGLVDRIGPSLEPRELIRFRAGLVEATRSAVLLYPTNATLHARLADASAEVGMYGDAAKEAREALRLDAITPHADKKLSESLRNRLKEKLPKWEEAAPGTPSTLGR